MLIDWFTVCAQVLNFLILVWLMKRYLYKPILNAIDTREKLIAKDLADADGKVKEATAEREEFQKKNEDFDNHRSAMLAKATNDVKAARARLLAEVQQAADALTKKNQETLIGEAQHLNHAVSLRTQKEVFAVARKTLTDLASAGLEEQMSEVFVRKLKALNGKEKDDFTEAMKTSSGPATVRSTFDLPAKQQTAIQDTLHTNFSATPEVKFETSQDLVGGIDVTVIGRKISWSIAAYLDTLENNVSELMNKPLTPTPKDKDKEKDKEKDQAKPPTALQHKAKAKPVPDKGKATASNR